MDEVSDYAQRFAPIHSSIPDTRAPLTVLPSHLATAIAPRRNLCAEFSALPTDKLLAEAESMLVRLDHAGRPTDHAILVALMRRVSGVKLDGAIWLPLSGAAA